MRVTELRERYLGFFEERGHKVLESSPLVPRDPTLLFTAAGMVPFKEILWGKVTPSFSRATTCQKCFRTTDIENVGRTAFHHTFFEMLGNFSFGDYFKEGAIEAAWAFLGDELGLAADRLWVSIYEDDDEAEALWLDLTEIPKERIVRLGKEHNWWGPVGDSGPCGPDSEIFYDAGVGTECGPDCRGVACECDRFSEIWNLVFMQYAATPGGRLEPLEARNIDTGMGLERTAAVLQGVGSDFEIDLFGPIVEAIESAVPRELTPEDLPFRNTIADHIRGIPFLLAEGVMPGNERQGYVMRRVLRRAIRAGERLDLPAGTMASFIDPVIDGMSEAYPEISEVRDLARRLVAREEETFRQTLREGERRLTKLLTDLSSSGERILPGELAFELTDTYGFPLEMTREIAAEAGVDVDLPGFEASLAAQRRRSRAALEHDGVTEAKADLAGIGATRFLGYEDVEAEAEVLGAEQIGETAVIMAFAESPFYAEAGGQIADTGRIENLDRQGTGVVTNVAKSAEDVFLHHVERVTGAFETGDRCRLRVDVARRRRIERNHTATHILHAALREVLGSHVHQAGSVVNDRELRFDFSHFERLTEAQIVQVEDLANAAVLADHPVTIDELPPDEAKATGAIGLFEDEYRGRATVRVIAVDDVSRELCGGTHVRRSGEIGLIKIVSEESIASGVRRIRAITGDAVLEVLRSQNAFAVRMREALGEDPEAGARRLKERIDALSERLSAEGADRVRSTADELISQSEAVGEVHLVGGRVDLEAGELKDLGDLLEERGRPAVIVLGAASEGRGVVVCKVSKGIESVHAGEIVRSMSKRLGGGGGGGPAFAQGGGGEVDALDEAVADGLSTARKALSGA